MTEETDVMNEKVEADDENGNTLADLSIKDLMALRSIIDLASQRGAFKPTEMVTIGQSYGKLNDFLETVIAQQRAKAAS